MKVENELNGRMYNVSASPHIRSQVSTATIMRDVCIALLPACAFGVYWFGFHAFMILVVSVTTCVLSEYIFRKAMKKPARPYECSAIITGLLVGMNMPSTVPLWLPIIGSVFAIIIVKELYGGLGNNFMNPALAARCFLVVCFASRMAGKAAYAITPQPVSDSGSEGMYIFQHGAAAIDGVSGATPLAVMKAGESVDVLDLLFGYTGGVIGETSVVMILIGAVYMLYRGVISLKIPLTYLATFSVFVVLFGDKTFDLKYLACQLCAGGLMLGAWFMATDYVTSPVTPRGQIVFGICLGLMTGVFRLLGNNSEGVSYAIIFCNLLVPLIEKWTMPKAFGKGGSQYVKQ